MEGTPSGELVVGGKPRGKNDHNGKTSLGS